MSETLVVPSLFEKLDKDRPLWANEEEVRISWLKHIEHEISINFHAERGRNDASFNQVIIEFKARGLFRGSTESASFKNAIFDRLHKYIQRRSKEESIPAEEYIGIAIDGDHVCFAFFKNGTIHHRNLLPFDASSVALVAQACLDSKRRAITDENLVEDFGHNSQIGQTIMRALANELELHLNTENNNKIKMLFEEWQTLFGQVADLSAAQSIQIQKQISIEFSLTKTNAIAATLFVIHTYNALVMKFLAAEIVAEYGLTAHTDFCEHLLSYKDDQLLEKLEVEVERSAYFEAARIKGFVEEAVFSWYTDISLSDEGKSTICQGIRALLIQLSMYRMDDLSAARSKDVLKAFYQSLVPETLRKALGEFYTPDWLVDIACDKAAVSEWYNARVLDPTCGSGSFLLEAIRRKRIAAKKNNFDPATTLKKILETVWGFDLNPLAVQSSRVNFLIAIADLVGEAKIEVELPVLLADAVYSPAHSPHDGNDFIEYRIGSAQSDLKVVLPRALAFDRRRLDDAFVVMADAVEGEHTYAQAEKLLLTKKIITSKNAEEWRDALRETYEQILELHKKSWNGIWFRIVRNFFWSAVAGQFDVIIGNPPWVRWSNLPEMYRERIKSTCEQYSIFSETPYHGGNELDISGMLTYTVGDKWLKTGGTLVFVITQTHFQSPSSQGFRSFKINSDTNLIPIEVDDLKKLKPFPKVANKTAIMRLTKTKSDVPIKYPVPYNVWEKAQDAGATIPEKCTKQEVLNRVEIKKWEATPVDGGNSPWAILPKGRFEDMNAIQGTSDWLSGRKGVTTDLNGLYMVRISDINEEDGLVQIETRPEAGRTDIGPKRRYWIEPDLLYPLLKGAGDFSACHLDVKEDLFVLVPNNGIRKADYASSSDAIISLNHTEKFFKAFKDRLSKRSTYRLRQKNAPYYSIYNSGTYTFAPYKVVWAEQSTTFEAVVITNKEVPLMGNRPFVPDHKVYFSEFNDPDTAYYVCGLLNSEIVREYIESHTIQIQVSNIFKHLSLPRYDQNDPTHKKISKLCQQSHAASTVDNRQTLMNKMNNITELFLKS